MSEIKESSETEEEKIRRVWTAFYQRYSPAAAVSIQANWRGYWCRQKLRAQRNGTLIKTARESTRRELASIVIQRWWRGYLARCQARECNHAIVVIQKSWRMWMVRRGWRRRLNQWRWRNEAAVVIQAHIRGFLSRLNRKRLKEAADMAAEGLKDEKVREEGELTKEELMEELGTGHRLSSPNDKKEEGLEKEVGVVEETEPSHPQPSPQSILTEDPSIQEALPSSSSQLDPAATPSPPPVSSELCLHPPVSSLEPSPPERQLWPLKSMPRLTPHMPSSPVKQQAPYGSAVNRSLAAASQPSPRIRATSIAETISAARNEVGLPSSRLHLLKSTSSSAIKK